MKFAFFWGTFLVCFSAFAQTAGFTPLIKAVTQTTSEQAIIDLIENGGNVNATDDQGRTVLMLAAMRNPNPVVTYVLIKNGADVNARIADSGKTALFFATQYSSNPDVVIMLINNGADQDITDIFGRTAFDYIERNPKIKGTAGESIFKDYVPEEEESSDSGKSR